MVVNPLADAAPAADAVGGTLLVVSAAEEVAKRIESHLRNAGHPLRVDWTDRLEDIEDRMRNAPPDLLLCDRDVRGLPRDRVLSLCRAQQPDLPVVLIGRQTGIEASIAALAAGAQDVAAHEDVQQLRHLELVVLRELIKHQRLRQLRQAQAQLADFDVRHRLLTEAMSEAVGLVQEGILASGNPALATLLGYEDARELAGLPLIDLVDPEQRGRIKDQLRAAHNGKSTREPLQLKLAGRNGSVEVMLRLIPGTQDGERAIELLIQPLPGKAAPVPQAPCGRGALAKALSEAPADSEVLRSALLLHIDNFDELEQRVGHADAEEIGAQIIAAVQSRLAPTDRLFGFSPGEIALLVLRPDDKAIEQFGDSLRLDIVDRIFTTCEHEAQASLSIAIHTLDRGDEADTVIRTLVAEVRQLSANGGNAMSVLGAARASRDEREHARQAGRVRRALAEDGFKLAYQSIASLEGDARSHYDILLRMLDEQGQEIRAAEFLPSAQKFDLMRAVDRWVVGTALNLIARRPLRQAPATLFVKLSEDTLRDAENFIAWLREVTQSRPLKSEEIVFEIQERVLQNHIRKARMLTQTLHDMGAGIAIEHFGVGTGSIQMLDHIRTGYLKFHASFTQHFGERDSQKLMQDLLEAAKQRRIKTIVCHVEDANVMARLWQMGVNFIQGYHINEPETVMLGGDVPARH